LNAFAALLLGAATVAAAAPGIAPLPPSSAHIGDFAPADQYFGRMKMSYLGINNTFRDAAIVSGDHTTDSNIANKVFFADEALGDWSRRYPHDRQLARSYFLAIRAEQKIWLKVYQEKAWTYMNRLATQYPGTFFGKTIKREIAIGFTEHYFAAPVVCVSPAPAPTTTPVPRGSGLKIMIETPPCIQPTPSPSPSPSALPSASPSPAASGSSAPAASDTSSPLPDAAASPSAAPAPSASPT
jgi:hypothetical protein